MAEACLLENSLAGDSLGQQAFSLNEPQCPYMEIFFPESVSSENKVQSFTQAARVQTCTPAKGSTAPFINFQPVGLAPWLYTTIPMTL